MEGFNYIFSKYFFYIRFISDRNKIHKNNETVTISNCRFCISVEKLNKKRFIDKKVVN